MGFKSSGINNIDALLKGEYWSDTGKPATLSYSVATTGSGALSNTHVEMLKEAFKQWSLVANISFTQVNSGGNIRIAGQSGEAGVSTSNPDWSWWNPFSWDTNKLGHVDVKLGTASGLGIGARFLEVATHEIGHAIGLKHPGNYNEVNGKLKGGESPFLPYQEDNTSNTVMSYNNGGRNAATPMAYDIRAIQYLYGARSLNPGDTTYKFDTVNSYHDGSRSQGLKSNLMKLSLWDSGGIDTLDLSKLETRPSGYHFDINGGNFLTTNDAFNAGKYTPRDKDKTTTEQSATTYGTSIAFGTQIENVIGTSSNDIILGNGANNVLKGGGGDDVIHGNGGSDSLYGEAGNDILYGDSGSFVSKIFPGKDFLYGGDGDDTLYGREGDDYLDGGTGKDIMYGGSGNDRFIVDSIGDRVVEYAGEGTDWVDAYINFTLPDYVENLKLGTGNASNGYGNSLVNSIIGNTNDNFLWGYGGNDYLEGGVGNDNLYGGDGDDNLAGGENRDLLYGGNDQDTLLGGNGDDYLFGESGNDKLLGGTDKDTLVGGVGNDTLLGGTQADTFYFLRPNEGADFIQDFNRAEGDKIQILARGFGGKLTAGQLSDSQFVLGASATSSAHRFIFNTSTNILSFDSDGVGGMGAQELAKVGPGVTLTNSDIWVV
jgi:Ca2+-binding RTX toxin-like protein